MAGTPPPENASAQPGGGKVGRRWTIWSKSQKLHCIRLLHLRSTDGALDRGALTAVAGQLGVSLTRVTKLWKKFCNTPAAQLSLTPKKKGARLHIRTLDIPSLKEAIKKVNYQDRKTYCDLARELEVPRSTLFEYKQRDKVIKRDNSRLRPKLTPHNQVHRMIHARGQVGVDSEEFNCLFDSIHIDEKWFYVEQNKEGFLVIAPDGGEEEENTYRSTKSKNFIKKVMFLAAVARPWEQFSGKIGIWAFVEDKIAQRDSVNRPAGTVELASVNVNRATRTSKC
jgi:hypothetical protein